MSIFSFFKTKKNQVTKEDSKAVSNVEKMAPANVSKKPAKTINDKYKDALGNVLSGEDLVVGICYDESKRYGYYSISSSFKKIKARAMRGRFISYQYILDHMYDGNVMASHNKKYWHVKSV